MIAARTPVRGQDLTPSLSNPPSGQPQTSRAASDPSSQSDGSTKTQAQEQTTLSSSATQQTDDSEEQQSKRLLWIIPNYRAVSAGTRLPPLSFKEEIVLATQDSFDYSSFILAGLLAGYGQITNSTPEFHQGLAGYGRYYWHSFADEAIGNYLTEAIVPAVTREDPRYYTLGKERGGFWHRTGYAMSRLVVTRTDSGGRSFNVSEIAGNAIGAGVSDFYYPRAERTLSQTTDKWATQVGVDGIANFLKEFWPDIRHGIFRQNQ
jgi:hypothetical protein